MSPIFLISILIQLALVIHVFKTGRNTVWIFIVLFAPVVGALAYVILELLPELFGSRSGRNARAKLTQAINPGKALREAEERYAMAGTIKNAMLLAELYVQDGRFADAKKLYQDSLTGIYADDPHLLLGLATAHHGLQEYADAVRCLDQLKQKNPLHTSEEGHLLYAKCLQGLGRDDEAMHEFEALSRYYAGPEPACRLGQLLKKHGQTDKANALFRDILTRARRGNSHYRQLHQEWINIAKSELTS